MTRAEERQKLRKELKELRIKVQPLNAEIFKKECELVELEEVIKAEEKHTTRLRS